MDEEEKKKLWEEYSKTCSPETREKIIVEYAPLVKLVAGRLCMYLGNHIELDDLIGYGIFGLIDAIDKFEDRKSTRLNSIDKFDPSKAVKFETYASLRIRGAILDQVRKMDWIPRTIRQRQKKIENAVKEVEAESGKKATDKEVSENLGITEEEYYDWQTQMNITNVVSLNEFTDQGSEVPVDKTVTSSLAKPEEVIEQNELKLMMKEALETLTERERKVIVLYYYEELTLKEVSHILGVSESRVSQLHTKGLQKMKKRLGNYMGILTDNI